MRFRMPSLTVETYAEVSGESRPVGLTRLTLSEFAVTASRVPSEGLTRIDASLASLLLENTLPDQGGVSGWFKNILSTYIYLSNN